jgi:hypothetical protein
LPTRARASTPLPTRRAYWISSSWLAADLSAWPAALDVDWPTRRRSMSTNLARKRNLFPTVVPLPFGRLAAAAGWSAGRACASGVEQEPSAPLGLVESNSLASCAAPWAFATRYPPRGPTQFAASTPQPQQGSTSALVASRLCSNDSGHRRKPNCVAPTLAYGFFMNDDCSVSSPWIRPSQVRLARTANASINVGCGGVRVIGFGPNDGRRNGGKKRFARKGR